MNPIQIRFILFLFGCIGMRLLFVIIAKNVSIKILYYLGYLALFMAFVLLSSNLLEFFDIFIRF